MGEDDLPGKLGELIRYGTVEEVDLASGKVTVRVGEIVTDKVRWIGAAGGTRIWLRPKVGEQLVLLAPDGDIEGAIALRGVICDSFPALGEEDLEIVEFEDGGRISYDPSSHALVAVLPAGASARIVAENVTIVGDVRIEGKLTVTEDAQFDAKLHADGEIKSDDDVLADTIKLKTHKTSGVTPGGGLSGNPVA